MPRDAPLAGSLPGALERAGLPRESPYASLRQVHGAAVHVALPGRAPAPEGDGLVSGRAGLALVIQTADCLPVLLADTTAGIAGAAHAGWRGILAGVLEATVGAMANLGADPERLEAALGPAIGACCFEVGEEVAAAFARLGPTVASRPGARPRVDLAAAATDRLAAAGVTRIHRLEACTRCRNDRFYSHRAESGRAGRLLSIVAAGPAQASGAPSTRYR